MKREMYGWHRLVKGLERRVEAVLSEKTICTTLFNREYNEGGAPARRAPPSFSRLHLNEVRSKEGR